ncbi:hypothetical protein ABKN59_007341 [Abortiporus biennis]
MKPRASIVVSHIVIVKKLNARVNLFKLRSAGRGLQSSNSMTITVGSSRLACSVAAGFKRRQPVSSAYIVGVQGLSTGNYMSIHDVSTPVSFLSYSLA